jgi:pilus assembly protein FimV
MSSDAEGLAENSDLIGGIDLDELAAADDEFDFLAGTDECATKLDLARAYVDMEDADGARELLQEVIQEGNDEQKSEAKDLIDKLS